MILIVLGTWKMSFARPLHEIENLLKERIIRDQVIVQSGYTFFNSKYMTVTPFFDKKHLESLYRQANLVICQAGIGSIMMGLQNDKKVISIARKSGFDEHIDDHQEEILNLFSKKNFVLKWEGNGDLKKTIDLIENFTPDAYPFSPEKISGEIIKYINTKIKLS